MSRRCRPFCRPISWYVSGRGYQSKLNSVFTDTAAAISKEFDLNTGAKTWTKTEITAGVSYDNQ